MHVISYEEDTCMSYHMRIHACHIICGGGYMHMCRQINRRPLEKKETNHYLF